MYRLIANAGYGGDEMEQPVTIRLAGEHDRERIAELAELDSRRAPAGPALLAEVHGRLWAAVAISDGAAVADPFVPAGDIVGLLRLRAEQEREGVAGRGPLHRWPVQVRGARERDRMTPAHEGTV